MKDYTKRSEEFYNARGCRLIKTADYGLLLVIPFECPQLTTFGCSIYHSRPEACRDFDGSKSAVVKYICKWKELEDEKNISPIDIIFLIIFVIIVVGALIIAYRSYSLQKVYWSEVPKELKETAKAEGTEYKPNIDSIFVYTIIGVTIAILLLIQLRIIIVSLYPC